MPRRNPRLAAKDGLNPRTCGVKPSTSTSTTLFGLPKLPPRCAGIVMPLLLSIFMTCIVSGISTLRSLGPVPGFVGLWLGAWAWSWLVAFPTMLLVMPLVRKATAALVRQS
jgi:hypothetical protein